MFRFLLLSVLSLILVSPNLSYGKEKNAISCRAVKIFDNNVFEEGLSTDEYPDVWVTVNEEGTPLDAYIGSALFQTSDGAQIKFLTPSNVIITSKGWALWVNVNRTSPGPRPGVFWGNIVVKQGAKFKKVALLVCK